MNRIKSRTDLDVLKKDGQAQIEQKACRLFVCSGTGCVASGSEKVYNTLCELAKNHPEIDVVFSAEEAHEADGECCKGCSGTSGADDKKSVSIKKSGCHGFCEIGPLVRVEPQGLMYTKVTEDDCKSIFEKTVLGGEIVHELLYHEGEKEYMGEDDIPFFQGQTRLVLKRCGHIDAEDIHEYIASGGYQSLAKALFDMKPDDIVNEIYESNLRGRGGGGFRAGTKWKQVASQQEKERYVVCNGDEGDPGAFMDCAVMEGIPHQMIEGMLIAAYAVQAHEGYIYVRAEYPLAVKRLKLAIAQAESMGLLGDNILGTGFSFHLHINRGAGAFVCGEGSALTASIEGKRGMPRVKPPRTVSQGLFAKPTVLNNVETYANVPMIIENGAHWYRSIGPENSPGTKTFSLSGTIRNTGLIEVPMGTKLGDVIFGIGGGIKNDQEFKAVQLGGPSGGCLTKENLDLSLDFDSLKKTGAIIGSGGMVVMDQHTCMVEVARFFMNFTQRESCGKCVPCREGTTRMLEILQRIVEGKGEPEDLDKLLVLADMISSTALCGLGKSAPLPVVSTIRAFRDEYMEHIVDKKCRAKVCDKLKTYVIDPQKCKGCSRCAKNCPVNAISGEIKSPFTIDNTKCVRCGVCMDHCSFDAIYID